MIKKKFIFLAVFMIANILILPSYVTGDRANYQEYYETIIGLSLSDSFVELILILSAFEPIFFIISWFSAQIGFNYIVFSILLNLGLALAIIRVLERAKVSPVHLALILFGNFYFTVLFTELERLKLGFLFLFLAKATNESRYKYTFSILSILSHFQIGILIFALNFEKIFKKVYRFGLSLKFNTNQLVLGTISLSVLLFVYLQTNFGSYIFYKLSAYSNNYSILGILKYFSFGLTLIIASTNRKSAIYIVTSLFPFMMMLGEQRINIFLAILITYEIVKNNKSGIFIRFAITIFFLLKSMSFWINFIEKGRGF